MRTTAAILLALLLPAGVARAACDAVLTPAELSDARLVHAMPLPWVRAPGGPSSCASGAVQEVVWRNVTVRIQYGAFESAAAAHTAACFQVANASAFFRTGALDRAQAVGDETWWTRGASAHALLIRSGSVCVLVSCREGDAVARDRAAEEFAGRVAARLRALRRPGAADPGVRE